jgi:hypothetical protein
MAPRVSADEGDVRVPARDDVGAGGTREAKASARSVGPLMVCETTEKAGASFEENGRSPRSFRARRRGFEALTYGSGAKRATSSELIIPSQAFGIIQNTIPAGVQRSQGFAPNRKPLLRPCYGTTGRHAQP